MGHLNVACCAAGAPSSWTSRHSQCSGQPFARSGAEEEGQFGAYAVHGQAQLQDVQRWEPMFCLCMRACTSAGLCRCGCCSVYSWTQLYDVQQKKLSVCACVHICVAEVIRCADSATERCTAYLQASVFPACERIFGIPLLVSSVQAAWKLPSSVCAELIALVSGSCTASLALVVVKSFFHSLIQPILDDPLVNNVQVL